MLSLGFSFANTPDIRKSEATKIEIGLKFIVGFSGYRFPDSKIAENLLFCKLLEVI